MTVERRVTRTHEDPRSMYYEALAEAERRGARIVLDAIADTGFFGITGQYGDVTKRDQFIDEVLRATVPR